MKQLLAPLACALALASTATAQLSNYLGPGILTGGAGAIGNRSGEQVDLRLFADVTGVYDNGFQPVSVDSKGNLVQLNGLYGIQANVGAYGTHSWRAAQLGLDYTGSFVHYVNDSAFDYSNQSLKLGYTYQKSQRLYFDFQGIGGTYSNYLGTTEGETTAPSVVTSPTLLLFDNRTYFLEGSARMTYLLSARASLTVGGDGFLVDRQSSALVSMNGYGERAKLNYRLSRITSIGAEYNRQHYQYQGLFGDSNINEYEAYFATQMGRLWTFSLSGGAFQVNTTGLETVSLSPAIAALLGVSTTVHTFAASNWLPSARGELIRKFKNSSLVFSYSRTVVPGNGVYLTSRTDTGTGTYSYTGVRNASFAVSGGYASLASVGQGLEPYQMYTGGARGTYNLTHALHIVAGYDIRRQEIQQAELGGFRRTSYRASLGIAFSPGALPLSFW